MKDPLPNIELYKSLFRGREDVYAVRWEKEGRSGYMPAYKVDWTDYNKHKASGGTFASYTKKEFLPFNDDALAEHLKGNATLGIYPLLTDNTSFFIAADTINFLFDDCVSEFVYRMCSFRLPNLKKN